MQLIGTYLCIFYLSKTRKVSSNKKRRNMCAKVYEDRVGRGFLEMSRVTNTFQANRLADNPVSCSRKHVLSLLHMPICTRTHYHTHTHTLSYTHAHTIIHTAACHSYGFKSATEKNGKNLHGI